MKSNKPHGASHRCDQCRGRVHEIVYTSRHGAFSGIYVTYSGCKQTHSTLWAKLSFLSRLTIRVREWMGRNKISEPRNPGAQCHA